MAVRVEMPQLSSDGESAALASWLVKAGDTVEAGEVIAELETDKSTVELESPAAGVVAELLVAEGTEEIQPGTLLASIEAEEGAARSAESTLSSAEVGSADSSDAQAPSVMDSKDPAPAPPKTTTPRGAARSTPLARRAAAQRGLELDTLEGSGPGGRILEDDVLRSAGGSDAEAVSDSAEAADQGATGRSEKVDAGKPPTGHAPPLRAQDAGAAEGDFEAVRLSAMRKTIARRMTESKQQVPHFYLSARVAMDELMEVRGRLNAELASAGRDVKISVNDFIVRAAALALRDVPAANVRFAGDAMHVFGRVDIAIAVATDGGLVTPVVRAADRKGLTLLASEIRALAERTRAGSLRPEEYQEGTFTVSNLGMYGIETVYPILNPPQACILGVGAAEQQPVVRDGKVEIGRVATITLAADHRVVDGAVGAELLAAIRSRLEDPLAMIL